MDIRPQPGPQEKFLAIECDIVLFGGAAGGAKTFSLLLDPLRHIDNSEFGAVIFRRTMPQIKNEGGMFDESMKLYPLIGGVPNLTEMYWKFPSGATISFSHIEHEKNVFDWQGSQIAMIGFDEITHFTKRQFFYMLSRNRSTCGVRPYIRATTNPDKKSWVRNFIDWWIYPKGHPKAGLAIPERSGVVRYFIVENDKIEWFSRRKDAPEGSDPKSFTFISATVFDNKILLEKDPSYLANLKALPRVERKKLLDANWDAEESPGELFQRSWFPMVKAVPGRKKSCIRYWDRAASELETADYTVGLKLSQLDNGMFCVEHMERFRGSPSKVEARIKTIAIQDTIKTMVGLEEDPGQAGKSEIAYLTRQLSGFDVRAHRVSSDKLTRALPVSAQAEQGNVYVMEGSWNEDFFAELEAFDGNGKGHDDIVDTLSGAFTVLTEDNTGTFTNDMAEYSEKEMLQQW